MALGIHEGCKARPGLAHVRHRLNAAAVVNHQLIPQGSARGHPVVPGHVMEPEEEVVRGTLEVRKLFGYGWRILRYCVAAGCCPIKADSLLVSPVEINRGPVGARAAAHPGSWAVVPRS